jgi:hypothetical protein
MPVPILKKIRDMVRAGATVIGMKPEKSAGLHQYEDHDRQVREMADELWGKDAAEAVDKSFGKGRIVSGKTIREVLSREQVLPDMEYKNYRDTASIDFIHRTAGDAEIYYIANLSEKTDYLNATFRVTGKTPQLWNPADGSVTDQLVYTDDGERISLPLYFDPYGSMFVVFREQKEKEHIISVSRSGENIFPGLPRLLPDTAYYSRLSDGKWVFDTEGVYEFTCNTGQKRTITADPVRSQEIAAPWQVAFSKEWGGPEEIVFDRLMSWTESDLPGIKYYSGTASYTNTFPVAESRLSGNRIYLDLGEMFNIAEVIINGKNLGTCWKKPFKKDISQAVIPGINTVELKVTNLWPNRLIGDQHLPETEQYTETNYNFGKDDPLRPSGLLGPVRLFFIPEIANGNIRL